MAANKVKGVRAGLAYNVDVARLMREHNDANVIGFGAKFTTLEEASERVDTFLATEFAGGRHAKRVEMLKTLDK
jgi:ribose 5-phosphate isomerase B